MKVPKRIIRKISRIIKGTSAPYSQALPETQRHLLPQVLLGLLASGSAYASDVARKIGGGSIGAKEVRVLRFAHHPKLSLSYDRLLEAHIQRLSRITKITKGDTDKDKDKDKDKGGSKKGGKLRIYGDISELVKPWSVKMDAIDTVRDGSDAQEKKKSGYWLNEVYISADVGRIIPVVFYPFPPKRGGLRVKLR